jgi:hypothetical protein
MKVLVTAVLFTAFFISDFNSNTNFENRQSNSANRENCGTPVNFVNSTSSDLTISFSSPYSQFQTITVPANSTVSVGNYPGLGAWTFRILGGLDGSIACFESTSGVTECLTISSNDRFCVLQNPFLTSCGGSYDFVFADYNQC